MENLLFLSQVSNESLIDIYKKLDEENVQFNKVSNEFIEKVGV